MMNCQSKDSGKTCKTAVDLVIADVKGDIKVEESGLGQAGEVERYNLDKIMDWPLLGSKAQLEGGFLGAGACGELVSEMGRPKLEKKVCQPLWDSKAQTKEGLVSLGPCPTIGLGWLGEKGRGGGPSPSLQSSDSTLVLWGRNRAQGDMTSCSNRAWVQRSGEMMISSLSERTLQQQMGPSTMALQ